MTIGGLEHVAQCDDFLMKGAACRAESFTGFLVFARCGSMDTVLLNEPRSDFRGNLVPEEGRKVNAEIQVKAFHVFRVALPGTNYFVFMQKLLSRLSEC